mmetsp:Transcript_76308/g.223737  ORF Transcript_76308/g.223737 Transcript_76308/m.223737 type:complete len:280 (-) Transcript_76308:39-878(-)
MPEGRRVLAHSGEHDSPVGPQLRRRELQRQPLVPHRGQDDLPVRVERLGHVSEHPAVLPHGSERHRTVAPQGVAGAEECPASAGLHSGEHDVLVGLQLLRRVLQGAAARPHRRGHDLAVGPEGLRDVPEGVAVPPHGRQRQPSIPLQAAGDVLDGGGVALQRSHGHLPVAPQLLAQLREGLAALPQPLKQPRPLHIHAEQRHLGLLPRHGVPQHLPVFQRLAPQQQPLRGRVQALRPREAPLQSSHRRGAVSDHRADLTPGQPAEDSQRNLHLESCEGG